MIADFRRRSLVSIALTLPVLALSPLIQDVLGVAERLAFPGDAYVLFAVSSAVFFYGGRPFLTGSAREMRDRSIGMMTLIAVAITTAYAYSSAVTFGLEGEVFYWELATLIDVMLVGHWIEMRSVGGASRALEELAKLMPSEAHLVEDDGSVRDVAVEELESGDRVRVKPGEKLPADGVVVEGETSVDEAMVTGESKPVSKGADDEVIGGSINGEGSITVEVRATGEGSFLSQVMGMVEQAQQSKSKTQNLADRAASWLTVTALSVGAITFATWFFAAGSSPTFALGRTVTVMVITCPHALGLAIPLVVAISTALGARNGLLIRDRDAFEGARDVDVVVFDKTGTLTLGEFGVTDIMPVEDAGGGTGEGAGEGADEDAVLRLAAAVEKRSEHPIAAGVVRTAEDRGIDIPEVEDFQAIKGKGAKATVDGSKVTVVSPGYLEGQDIKPPDPEWFDSHSEEGKTVVFVLADGEVVGALALADIIRDESREAVRRLEEMGVRPMMLTGDDRRVAAWVAGELGIEEYFAEVLPQEKSERIEGIQADGWVVAMTGDGVNDAPALARADLGVAVGAGTDVAVETADVVLVRSNPQDVADIIALSKATYRKMLQNLAWATGYNVIAIPLAAGALAWAGVVLSPAVGAALMSASTVIVAVNARLLEIPDVG